MSLVQGGLLALATALVAALLTGTVRRYALAAQLLDRPNERSSHTVPTPRGGGVAVVVTFLLAALLAGLQGSASPKLLVALSGAGLLVAVLGFVDDHRHVPARWRLLGHGLAAAWAIGWLHPLPPLQLWGGRAVDLGWGTMVLATLFIVWSINLFNFMDGIDGIAGVECICVAAGGALLSWWAAPAGPWPLGLLLAASAAGFLAWNFPPARIFMGDAGSGFMGFALALLAIACAQALPALLWSWAILYGCFVVDATTTLLRRLARGMKVYEAHRSHAYQFASRKHGSHKAVTLAVAAINVAWLLPMAWLVACGALPGVVGVVAAYAPLLALAWLYKAGNPASQGG